LVGFDLDSIQMQKPPGFNTYNRIQDGVRPAQDYL
jgi:hypothetical protein